MQGGSELLLTAAPWLGDGGSCWTPLWVICVQVSVGGSDPVKGLGPENMGTGSLGGSLCLPLLCLICTL